MAAKKTHTTDTDDIKQRFSQVLAQKLGADKSGESHTDRGSRVAPRIPVARKRTFRRKTG
jgi:hypothetical protein